MKKQRDVEYLYHSWRAPVRVGDYFEDCNYQAAVCIDVNGDDVTGVPLIQDAGAGGPGLTSCSLRHCGVRRIRRSKIAEYLALQPYDRHVIENQTEVATSDPDWMTWFGERLPKMEKRVEFGDHIAEIIGLDVEGNRR